METAGSLIIGQIRVTAQKCRFCQFPHTLTITKHYPGPVRATYRSKPTSPLMRFPPGKSLNSVYRLRYRTFQT